MKIINILQLRIEIFLFLIMFVISLKNVSQQSLILERICRLYLGYSEKLCNNLTQHNSIQETVQKITTRYNLGYTLVTTFPAVVSTTLLSPWSDKYGRKLPILAATIGLILEGIGLTVVSAIPSAPAYFIIIASIPSGIFGGYLFAISSCYTYISDIANEESRTIRFAVLQCFFVLADPLGMEIGGILYKYGGIVVVYEIALAALICGFCWIFFFVKETINVEKNKNFKEMICHLFQLDNLKDNLHICITPRPGNIRTQIWLFMLANSIALFCTTGSTSIEFLFANIMYKWENVTFSTITSVLRIAHGICLLIVVPIFVKLFKISENIICLLGILSYIGEFGIKCIAYHQWMYYLACIVGLIGGTSTVAVNSRLSLLVNENELSKIFAVLALCGAFMPVFSNIVFNEIYAQTLSTYLGASYLCMTFLLIIPAGIFIWTSRQLSFSTYQGIDNETNQTENDIG